MKKLIAALAVLVLLVAAATASAAKPPNGWKVKAYAPRCLSGGKWEAPAINVLCYNKVTMRQPLGLFNVVSLRVCDQQSDSQLTPSGPVPSMNWSLDACMVYGLGGVVSNEIKGTSGVYKFDYEIWHRGWYDAEWTINGEQYKKTGYSTAVMIPAPPPTPILARRLAMFP